MWPSNVSKPAKTRRKSKPTWVMCWAISWAARKGARAGAANTRAIAGCMITEAQSLAEAARSGRLEKVIKLAGVGVDLNSRDDFGWTPLMVASAKGHADVAAWLVQNGADVNLKSPVIRGEDAGKTALHLAV